jgi:hypothetical protein
MNPTIYESIIEALLMTIAYQQNTIANLNVTIKERTKPQEGECIWPESMTKSEDVKCAVFFNLFKGMEEKSDNGEVDEGKLIRNMIMSGLYNDYNEANDIIANAIKKGKVVVAREGFLARVSAQ